MNKKAELKLRVKKLKAENKQMRKVVQFCMQTIEEKDVRIAQLTSVIEAQPISTQIVGR
jgi:hypothetical protein